MKYSIDMVKLIIMVLYYVLNILPWNYFKAAIISGNLGRKSLTLMSLKFVLRLILVTLNFVPDFLFKYISLLLSINNFIDGNYNLICQTNIVHVL